MKTSISTHLYTYTGRPVKKIQVALFYAALLFTLLAFHSGEVNAQTITSFPFLENFDNSANLPDGWTQEFDINNLQWEIRADSDTRGNIAVLSNSEQGQKTMLVTPPMDLTSLSDPFLSFWHTQEVWSGDQDELRVYYKNSFGGNWVLLAEYTENIPKWTEEIIRLPNPSNDYYIAFEGTANFGHGVKLDDILVKDIASVDAAVTVIFSPLKGGSSEAIVSFKIRNWGANNVTSIPVAYQLNQGTPVTETFTGDIAFGDTARFSFTTPVNLANYNDYHLEVYAQLANDADHSNDTAQVSFKYQKGIKLYGIYSNGEVYMGFVSFTTNQSGSINIEKKFSGEEEYSRLTYAADGLYAIDGSNDLVHLDDQWEITWSAPIDRIPDGMAYDYSSNTMYAVGRVDTIFNLYTVDLSTGAMTFVFKLNQPIYELACDISGNLYGMSAEESPYRPHGLGLYEESPYTNNLYKINKVTGELSFINTLEMTYSLTFDHNSGKLFGIAYDSLESYDPVWVEIDPLTGERVGQGEIWEDEPYSIEIYVPYERVASAKMNKTLLPLAMGDSETLTVITAPSGIENNNVTWSSSAPNIADVDAYGKVTAKTEGETTITATTRDGGYTATCLVQVKRDNILIQGHLDHDKLFEKSTLARPVAYTTVILYGKAKSKIASADPRDNYPHKIAETQTDENGDFSFNVARGDYLVWVEMQGFTMTAPVTVDAEENNIKVFNVNYFLDTSNGSISGVVDVTSVSDPESFKVTIYPNPANDLLKINLDVNAAYTIRIYNSLGQQMIATNGNVPETMIDVSRLQRGFYFIRIECKGKLETYKLVIAR